jgi:hypothetical protein
MAYLEELVNTVNEMFDQNDDIEILRGEVVDLIQEKSRESFKNGLEAARNRKGKSFKQNSRKAK